MRENALPILERYGVDLVLSGHSHCYERSKFIHGHYGYSTTNMEPYLVDGGDGRSSGDGAYDARSDTGTVYVVAGSSGKRTGGALNHPVMVASLNELGSVVIDINSNRMDVSFIGDTPLVRDTFSIVKGDVYRLSTDVVGAGTLPPEVFYPPGSTAAVTAAPGAFYFFDHWSGDLAGGINPSNLVMDADKWVTGHFEPLLASNSVPLYWLAGHGLETNDAAVFDDDDMDQMLVWEEFQAGTDPTNGMSYFYVSGVDQAPGSTNLELRWSSVAGQRYGVACTTNPAADFQPIASNLPATPPWNAYTVTVDAVDGGRFYRVTTSR